MKSIQFFKQNWIGTFVGIVYGACSMTIFFFTLGYGASCPEAGPEVCHMDLDLLFPILVGFVAVPLTVWSIIFYSGQQLMLLLGMVTSEGYSSSYFATNILPGISFVVLLSVFGIMGGSVQKLLKIRKRSKI